MRVAGARERERAELPVRKHSLQQIEKQMLWQPKGLNAEAALCSPVTGE